MKLYHGDCLEEMKKIKDSSVDIIIADLSDKAVVLKNLWKQIWRVSKKNTPVFLFGDMKFGVELINSCPKFFKYEIVWDFGYIFIFYKHQPVYNYQKYHKVKHIKIGKVWSDVHAFHYEKMAVHNYDPRLPLNVVHGEKPFLLEFLLKYFSNEGDVCLEIEEGNGEKKYNA
jgi:hypothetical protein